MQPENKRILITGGLGGIGKPLVEKLIAANADITVVGRSDKRVSNSFAYRQADLSHPGELDALVHFAQQLQPDILINLAGINSLCQFNRQSEADISTMLQVNLLAPMQLARAVSPAMLARNSGQIVNVGSILGGICAPLFSTYSASKAGLRGFSESLRREMAGHGITVTHINPRAVATTMNQGSIAEFNLRTKTREDCPREIACCIYNAMLYDKKEVNIGLPERLYLKLNALLPVLIDDALIANRPIGEQILNRPQGTLQ